jgi:hypothetical protein
MVLVAIVFPGGDFLDQGLLVGDAPIEALSWTLATQAA